MAKKKSIVKKLNPKKKTMGQISKEVAAKTTPKSNVKILEGKSNKQRQKIMNAQRTNATKDDKYGTTASRYREEIE